MKLDNCINLDDLRRAAKRKVPKVIFDFIEGGIDDESGLTRNGDAFARRPLLPRYMTGVEKGDQRASVFGREYASPFGIAPTGGIGNFRRGGDLMLASAARAANIPFIMSGAATASMEDMVKIAPDHSWYQVYLAKDRSITDDMIRRADALGISTLVITVDVPGQGNRERNRRNGFGRPLRLPLAAKLNALKHPGWLINYLRHGIAPLPNWAPYAGDNPSAVDIANFVAGQVPGPVRWDDIVRIRKLWPGNLVVKGIMRVDDALRLADAGVDGLMVSNHGARQLDRAPSPLDVLPGIVDEVGERMTIMLDSGIQRGSDVLTALSLGAKFVFLGRGTLYGVVAGGEAGATHAINILSNEINQVMVQIGCPSLDALGPDYVEWDPDLLAKNRLR